jgi:nicotinate-nucleotide--dimethylbenzimidazole phosphoribosyltransferase
VADLTIPGIDIPALRRTILPPDEAAIASARARQNRLAKPAGSMGRLEALSVQLAGLFRNPRPSVARKAIVIMAADHGIVRQGVSAYPADVTAQMVLNFLAGGAAINVLARQAGARVRIVDVGVAADLSGYDGLVHRKVALGTADFTRGPAMTASQAGEAIQAGIDALTDEAALGLDLVATGEMGIGNTTPSSALTAVLTGSPLAEVTGRGTGMDEQGLQRKIAAIETGLAVNRPDPADAFDVLCKVGGLEIAGLAGVIIGGAQHGIPVVIDGFISSAAAVVAAGMVPEVKPYLIASHRSVERGHAVLLEHLGLCPLFDLDLRLGEGTGAALAFHVIEASVCILDEMATFAEAGVSDRED